MTSESTALPGPDGSLAPDPQDLERRRVLVAATSVVGGIGVAAAAVPFALSWLPSEKAKAAGAPVEAEIGALEPGELHTVEWRGKPVWILRRSEAMLKMLGDDERLLSDPKSEVPQQPEYARNVSRAIKPEYLVAVGLCTHLGCVPTFRPEVAPADLGPEWPGGFYCPCHGSKFDLAGRVFKGVPAPTNLVIPEYAYLSESRLIIGANAGKS